MGENQNDGDRRRDQQGGRRRDDRRAGGYKKGPGGQRGTGRSSQSRGPKRFDRSDDERKPRRDGDRFASRGPRRGDDRPHGRKPQRDGEGFHTDGPRRDGDRPRGGSRRGDETFGGKGSRGKGERSFDRTRHHDDDRARDRKPRSDSRHADGSKPFERKGAGKEFKGEKGAGKKRFEKRQPRSLEEAERAETPESVEAGEEKKSWTPQRERTVKSKKEYDRERMERLTEGAGSIYRGELDPRKKDEEEPRRKATAEQESSSGDSRYVRNDQASDFRDRFERSEASPARLAALYVTREVRRREAYAQQLIESEIDNSNMSAMDRAFATLLVLGVVSTQGTLDEIINRALANPRDIKPDVRDPLRISTYEIILLGKAPHAALDQGVELVKAVVPSASRLANAVLHRVLAMKDEFPFGEPTHDLSALARSYAFPEWMARMLVEDMGAKEASNLMRASNDPAPLFIAVNAIKATDAEVESVFAETGVVLVPGEAGGVAPEGCYRVDNPRILADGRIRRLISQGKILVSDAAAQAVASSILENGEPESLLEVGAGRGTKSILIQSAAQRQFGHQISMTSMDSHSFKMDLLAKRAEEYGVEIAELVTGNAVRLNMTIHDREFDAIFIDAPCSGLGTLRRHHEIRWRITREHIDELADTGLAMLKSAASHVKPGGQIVYSTCTVTYAENNGVVKRFLESGEGSTFELAPFAGKACFVSQLSTDSSDAHFACRFVKRA